MPKPLIEANTVEHLQRCLDILKGLDNAFKDLDEQWEEANKAHPDEEVATGTQYARHTELLGDIHAAIVDDLFTIRDNLRSS